MMEDEADKDKYKRKYDCENAMDVSHLVVGRYVHDDISRHFCREQG